MMFKKIFIGLAILLILTPAGIYFLTRPSVLAKIVQLRVNASAGDLKLTELNFENIQFSQNGLVRIQGVSFTALLPLQKEKWRGGIPVVYLDNLKSFLGRKKITVSFPEAHLKANTAQLPRISFKAPLTFSGRKWRITDGNVSIDSLALKGMVLTGLQAWLNGNEELLTADPWTFKWAGGNISGDLTASKETYKIHADVTQVDLSEIARMKSAIFGPMHGHINGRIEIEWEAGKIRALKGYWDAPSGVEMRAVFLKLLLPYLPPSAQKNILTDLIVHDAVVFFDHADVYMTSPQSDLMEFEIKLLSQKLNLNIDLKIDLNMDGGLKNF